MLLLGVYGPIKSGTAMENLAIVALRDKQEEEIRKTILSTSAVLCSEGGEKELTKLLNNYLDVADPYSRVARLAKDKRMLKLMEKEVERGPIQVSPLTDDNDKNITFRSKPRLSRRNRKKKRK
jgi:hypothetical protein